MLHYDEIFTDFDAYIYLHIALHFKSTSITILIQIDTKVENKFQQIIPLPCKQVSIRYNWTQIQNSKGGIYIVNMNNGKSSELVAFIYILNKVFNQQKEPSETQFENKYRSATVNFLFQISFFPIKST